MDQLEESYIVNNWESDFDDNLYFNHLKNGDAIGYDLDSEQFSLNNYWNARPFEEISDLVKKHGLER